MSCEQLPFHTSCSDIAEHVGVVAFSFARSSLCHGFGLACRCFKHFTLCHHRSICEHGMAGCTSLLASIVGNENVPQLNGGCQSSGRPKIFCGTHGFLRFDSADFCCLIHAAGRRPLKKVAAILIKCPMKRAAPQMKLLKRGSLFWTRHFGPL